SVRGNVYVYFSPQSIWFYLDDSRVPYQPADGLFHTYLLTASGANRSFQFFVDGTLIKSGIVGPGESAYPHSIFFGDDSSGGDAATLDVDYVRYTNGGQPDLIATSLAWNTAQGGVDFGYSVKNAALTPDTTVALYWASGTTFDTAMGGPVSETPIE